MAGDDVTIVITAHNGDAIRAFRDTEGRLRDMRGRFIAEGHQMSGAMNRVAASIGGVRGSLIPLATAAVPLGAALAPIAVKAGAAGVAVAAFGAAVAGQVSYLSEASKAQDKYTASVAQYGRGSKQAAEAQRAVQASLASMPQATQRAAVAMGTLKDEFKGWSDDLAGFTMVPVEKSFTLMGQLLPKLTPMVKGASSQLDRLVTVAGGAMATPGFDALTEKISTFANSALKDAVDGIIHFSRALSEGQAGGPVQAFMEYAEKNGPALRETLGNMSDAVSTLVEAAANAGPGMLTLVNAAANLVASMPPELVTVLMQTAVALKLVSAAGTGIATVAGGVQTLGVRIAALQAASTAAGGGVAGLRAAVGSLSIATKGSIIVAALGAAALGINELAKEARGAPPDVDRLVTSLKSLASTGKFVGELKNTFGSLDGFGEAMGRLRAQSDALEKAKPLTGFSGMGSFFDTAVSKLDDLAHGSKSMQATKDDLKGLDEAFASMAKNGYADQAAAQFKSFEAAMRKQGYSTKEINEAFSKYGSVVADIKAEQDLTTDSMGIFGQAAQATSAKLDAQKNSADGLRASILALNDANRSAYDAQIGFEGALDDLSEAFAKNGATLDLNTDAGRANGMAMSQAAKSQDELIASGLAAGDSLSSMTKKSSELREEMMRLATDAFDGNKKKAEEYVNVLLGTPESITTLVKAEREDALTGLEEVRSAIQATPDAKDVKVSTLNAAAIKALEAVGYKTETLPDGRTRVYTANGQSIGAIGAVSSAMNNLDGKTATTYVTTVYAKAYQTFRQGERDSINKKAEGGPITGGSGTQDDVPLLAMGGEFIINKKQTQKYFPLIQAINDDRVPKFAKGGLTKSQLKGLSSPSDMSSLTGTLSDVRTRIKGDYSGAKEARLLRTLDSYGKRLIANEKSLTSVNKALDAAKDKLKDLKTASAQLASSVKSGVLSSANITRGVSGDSPVTVASIMGGLTASRDKATAFASALKGLKSKGLSSSLIQQIGEAGIEGGGLETAGALLGASSSEIGSINDLQRQIGTAAGSAGKTTADAVYASAIKSQTAATNRLQKSQDKLEKAMASLAKSLNRALGGKAAGGIVGFAASGGVRSNLTWVGEQGPELLDLPAGSRVWSHADSMRKTQAPWASMLNSPRRSASYGAGPVGGGQGAVPVVLEIRAGDSGRYTEFLVQELRRAVKANGSIEATLKPPRGR